MTILKFRAAPALRCWLALIVALVLTMAGSVGAQTNDTDWLGINANYYGNLNPDLQDLGIKSIRLGVSWQTEGNYSETRYLDAAKINPFVAAGYKIHLSINYRGYDLNNKKVDVADFETWVANYKEFCRQVITKWGSPGNVKIPYYICGNEPDLNDASTGNLTPYQAYRFSRALWEAKNAVNSALTTESAPVSSPTTNYLRDMINAGVADTTDVIGIHAYSNQFDNANLRKPWDFLQAAGKSKPISISEAGVPLNLGWQPAGTTDVYWRTRWHQLAYLQAKRFGYDRMLLFSHTGNSDFTDKWAYRNRNNGYAPIQTAYDEVKYGLRKRPNLNGGFEASNDKWHEWIMLMDINKPQAEEPNWADFASTSIPHAGARCLKITAASWTGRDVERIVPDLTIGVPCTLSIYAKVQSGGTASLRANGYNRTNGLDEKSASTSVVGSWTKLSVTFTPTNPWVVIVLDCGVTSATDAACYFDDAVVAQNSTAFNGTYKVIARHSGKCLDVDGGVAATQDGANVHQWDYLGQTNQQWIITPTDSGYYKLIAKNSGKALDLESGTGPSANGTNVHQWTYKGATNQQWKIEAVGGGYYKLTCRVSGRVLDVEGGVTATQNGANVHQWDYLGQTNQQWMLTQISTSTALAAPAKTSSSTAPSGGSS